MPFADGCKITSDANEFYYIINYRVYQEDANVESFTEGPAPVASVGDSEAGRGAGDLRSAAVKPEQVQVQVQVQEIDVTLSTGLILGEGSDAAGEGTSGS